MAPTVSAPIVRERKGWSLNLVMRAMMMAKPMMAAAINWPVPAVVSRMTGIDSSLSPGVVMSVEVGQPGGCLVGEFFSGSVEIERDAGLVGGEGFEGGVLGVNEAGWHEVAGPSLHPFNDDLPIACQVDEYEVEAGLPQLIAVDALESRARHDSAVTTALCQPGGDICQPGAPIVVAEGVSRSHLVDVGLGVEIVAVHEFHVQACGEHGSDVRLASSSHTHDNDWWHAVARLDDAHEGPLGSLGHR